MYDPKTGEWVQSATDNFNEHFETTYYLKYNIEKALYSLNKIMKSKIDYREFSNRCIYYHFYIDNVLNAIGHIRRRFFNNNVNSERIERNKKEYDYISIDVTGKRVCNYPIISNNEIRNFIEHIDERDEVLIEEGIYNGTFNVIYKGMNQQIKRELLDTKMKQNNLLNLLTKEYKIITIDKDTKKLKECTLNFIGLKKELEKLKIINDAIWIHLTEGPF